MTVIESLGIKFDMLMVMVFDVAVAGDAQVALEVITQKTWSPLASVLSAYAALLVPTFVPFFFHW